ncbi:MAG: sensor histidine kinase [Oryzihumus sp.]
MSRSRGSLARQISLLAVAVAVVTAVVAGALAVGLARQSNELAARGVLARLADAADTAADTGVTAQAGQVRARRTLSALHVEFATVSRVGRVAGTSRLAGDALTPQDVSRLLAGGSVSARRLVDGIPVLLEARSTPAGGIALVQPRGAALAAGEQAIRRTVLALVVAAAAGIALSVLLARRLARPLRRTADAAHQLAGGRRDVVVTAEGPAEVAEVADAVTTLARALSRSEARQRAFLLSVSHELRTPLTAITGYAESLAEGVVPPEEAPQVGAVMLGESERLGRLVHDLLDLARLGAEQFRVELVPADLTAMAGDAAGVWDARCAAAGVRFSAELPGAPVVAVTDAARVRQVLDGLLENALRVTPAGAPIVLAVRPEPGPHGGLVVAEVRDGGPGLAPEDLPVAFEPSALYDRYRGVRQVGTGLGLAIVHGLVTRLGGSVEAGYAPEGGARFTVRLPTAPGTRSGHG